VLRTTATTLTSTRGAAVTIAADGTYTYDPRAAAALQALNNGASLVDSFTYTVNDGRGGTATATMQVTVAGVTDGTTNPPTNPPTDPPPPNGATINGTEKNDTLTGRENVNDVIDGKGGHDTIRGLGADDTLKAGAGNDHAYGGAGNDRIEGGSGDDRLYGEAGNDRIDGGAGADWLIGDAGNDVFVYARGCGDDLVHGFNAGDKIDLSAFGFGNMAQLTAAANLVTTSSNTMYVDFGGGDRLTIYGLGKLTSDNVIF
jgi:VCBS repeat-containing protein